MDRKKRKASHLHNESRNSNLAGTRQSRNSVSFLWRHHTSTTKGVRANQWLWCFSRRGLWYLFWRDFRWRQRSIRAILCRRVSKSTKKIKNSDNHDHKLDTLKKNPGLSINCHLSDLITAENNSFKDYHKVADTQPSWRPSIPVEDGIWVPSPVETNDEGKKRLQLGWGDPLVEVFDIKVDLRGRKKTFGRIHGNITMDCTVYRIVLFDCDKESAKMVQQKKIDDDELCDDILVWNPSYHCTNVWLCDTLRGKKGSVHVTYAVVSQSWLAELDVRLITSTKENGSKIYGDIVVYINGMNYLSYFIFSKRRDDIFIVEPLQPIPLSRSLFVCPHGSSLVVKINLWNSDANQPLARGALLFPTDYYGDSVGEVSGQHDSVRVKVNWGRYMSHLKTRETIKALSKPNRPL